MNKCYLFGLLFLLACKCPQYTSETFPEKQLIIGRSGGFTGKESSYILLKSGQVFEKSFPEEKLKELKGIKGAKIRKFYKNAWKKTWKDYKYNKPGNLTLFVTFKDKNLENRIAWAPGDSLVSKEIRDLHKDILHIVNPKSIEK